MEGEKKGDLQKEYNEVPLKNQGSILRLHVLWFSLLDMD